jgi:hypothetical protein
LAAAVETLHWPETTDHGVWVVRVPDQQLLHFHYVLGDYYYGGGPDNWMGRQINIVTHGKPMELRITGRYRPPEPDPVEISVVDGSEVSRYRITEHDTKVLSLPADASVILTASDTFVPARTLRNLQNGDPVFHGVETRPLSVAIGLQPALPQ